LSGRVFLRIAALCAAVAIGPIASCSSSDNESAGAGGSGGCARSACAGAGAVFDAGPDRTIDVATPDTGTGGTGAAPSTNPLCEPGSCDPDEALDCVNGDASITADSGRDAGDTDGGDAAQAHIEQPGSYGVPDSSSVPALPQTIDGGDADAEQPPTPPFGCRVVANGSGSRKAECAPAGTGLWGDPCVSSADCAAGFACIGEDGAAQCREFCCAGNEQCKAGEYCAERALRAGDAEAALLVPVCTVADACSLGDPYPCPNGTECKCPVGTACAVVRDGTTSCVVPGTGIEQEPCPCAPGHVCWQSTGKCLKLCSPSSSTTECGGARCQAASHLPDGWGVCVGSSDGGS
jgi:hypothetical protein